MQVLVLNQLTALHAVQKVFERHYDEKVKLAN